MGRIMGAEVCTMRSRWVAALASLFRWVPALGWAQGAGSGSIEGVALDATGAVLPGVTVVVKNIDTGAERSLITDGSGRYRAGALQPGRYAVTGSLDGFEPQKLGQV